MFKEDDLVPLSGLQHMLFCDRQAALIHVERTWMDNALTVEGHEMHRIVDASSSEARSGVLVRRGVALTSRRLGIVGRADVVEFRSVPPSASGTGLDGRDGRWLPFPVEYKRGRPKDHRADEVQLCAQALCLEEMFDVVVPSGALFYGETRRRTDVRFEPELRRLTEATSVRFHELLRTGSVPVRVREAKCERCSLVSACLPLPRSHRRSARAYLEQRLSAPLGGGPGP